MIKKLIFLFVFLGEKISFFEKKAPPEVLFLNFFCIFQSNAQDKRNSKEMSIFEPEVTQAAEVTQATLEGLVNRDEESEEMDVSSDPVVDDHASLEDLQNAQAMVIKSRVMSSNSNSSSSTNSSTHSSAKKPKKPVDISTVVRESFKREKGRDGANKTNEVSRA